MGTRKQEDRKQATGPGGGIAGLASHHQSSIRERREAILEPPVESAPQPVKTGVQKDEAEAVKAKLEAEGATVEIR